MVARILFRKLLWEFDAAWGLAQYPFRRHDLLARLRASMPAIGVEVTNICNANCIFCAYQYQTRPTGIMDMGLYHKAIDEFVECGGGIVGLAPTVGDPLVDPHLLERIHYARSKPQVKRIYSYSNLILLDRIGAEALVHSGISDLTVSTSGFDEEMFQRVYRSRQYKKVLANIKALAAANNAANRPMALFIDMRVDRPLAEVLSYPDHREVQELVGAANVAVKFRYDSWGGLITPEQLSGNMKLRANLKPRLTACAELYGGPMVYWDGRVGGCNCRDVNARELVIGDLNRSHLGDIWFGAELARLRAEFVTGRQKRLCRECTHYNNASVLLRHRNRTALRAIKPSPYQAKLAARGQVGALTRKEGESPSAR